MHPTWLPRIGRFLGVGVLLLLASTTAFSDEADDQYEGDPEMSAELFDEAENLRERGMLVEAATKYWEAVDADLRNFDAYVRYIDSALRIGDPVDQIIGDLDSFIEDWPKLLGLRLHKLRVTTDAAERVIALEGMRKANATSCDLHLEIGRAKLASADLKGAIEALTTAAALVKGSRGDLLMMLANAEYDAGKKKEARARLDAAVSANGEDFNAILGLARFDLRELDDKKALERATQVLTMRAGHIAATLLKAESESRLEQMEAALATLLTARREYPKNADVAIAYADLRSREETEQSYKAAEVIYKDVLSRDEEDTRALYGLGWLYEKQEKFEEAAAQYKEVAAIRPDDFMAVNSYGYVLYKQGRISDAQVQFKKATDLNPDYVTAVLNLGATYDVQAKYNDGIKLYEKVLATKGLGRNMRALINCAFDYEALGVFPKALKMLLAAHKIDPKDHKLVVWIGDNHYFQKKMKDAVSWYQKAIELEEKYFFAWRGLGYALARLKRWEDCVKALEKANSLDEDDLDVMVALGDIYQHEIEDLEAALKWYQEYVQRGGDDPAVRDIIVEIQKRLK